MMDSNFCICGRGIRWYGGTGVCSPTHGGCGIEPNKCSCLPSSLTMVAESKARARVSKNPILNTGNGEYTYVINTECEGAWAHGNEVHADEPKLSEILGGPEPDVEFVPFPQWGEYVENSGDGQGGKLE